MTGDGVWQCLRRFFAVLLALLLCCSLFFRVQAEWREKKEESGLSLYVLDVGQGDAVLLRTDGQTLLIDTGGAESHDALLAALQELNVEHIDVLLLTHPHDDHVGNARAVLSHHSVGAVLTPDTASPDTAYDEVLRLADEKSTRTILREGDSFSLGKAACLVLSAGGNHKNGNDDSVVLRVTFGETALLFMGDAEAATETYLLQKYGAATLKSHFLKVGHHGSDTSTTKAFAEAVSPRVAAVGCGGGFSSERVEARLVAVGATVYRTDTHGRISFYTDGKTITVNGG